MSPCFGDFISLSCLSLSVKHFLNFFSKLFISFPCIVHFWRPCYLTMIVEYCQTLFYFFYHPYFIFSQGIKKALKECDYSNWSGWRESNSHSQLGRLKFYHWTTPAYRFGPATSYSRTCVLPSALRSLTSVFGMGTGVPSLPSSLDHWKMLLIFQN